MLGRMWGCGCGCSGVVAVPRARTASTVWSWSRIAIRTWRSSIFGVARAQVTGRPGADQVRAEAPEEPGMARSSRSPAHAASSERLLLRGSGRIRPGSNRPPRSRRSTDRVEGERPNHPLEQGDRGPQPLVVARLFGQVAERSVQVPGQEPQLAGGSERIPAKSGRPQEPDSLGGRPTRTGPGPGHGDRRGSGVLGRRGQESGWVGRHACRHRR